MVDIRKLAVVLALAAVACSPRQVEVRTAPVVETAPLPSLQVTNGLPQAVNVYVTASGTDTFVRQIPANSTQVVPVQGVAAGTNVTLKAVTADGTRNYTRANVVLAGTVVFTIP